MGITLTGLWGGVFVFEVGFKGCGMGTRFVLVSPCSRENVVVTYKIGSFLCSLDNLLQKNIIVFFFGNQISKRRAKLKGDYTLLLSNFVLDM